MAGLRIELVGDVPEDYISLAKALHQQGKRGNIAVDELALIQLKDRLICIILFVYEYAVFRQVVSGGAVRGAFLYDVDPYSALPFSRDLPAIPTYYPIYPDRFLAPLYNKLKLYEAGSNAAYLEASLLNPILSAHSEALVWRGVTFTPMGENGEAWIFLKYQLSGYLNQFLMPMQTKLITFDGTAVTSEGDASALNVPVCVGVSKDGVSYRRLKTGDAEKVVIYGHDDAAYSGMIYDIVLDGGTGALDLTPLPITAPGPGTRIDLYDTFYDTLAYPGGRHVDNILDIFTSERAVHYYVVRFTSDNALWYFLGKPKWDNMIMFSGMSLVVEKMSKADDTLVATYNLTPSAVDHVNQGATYLQQCLNAANADTLAWMTFQEVGYEIFTRFVPVQGAVLVAADGSEFPILTVIECSQDHFGLDGTIDPEHRRQNYVENGVIYNPPTQMNIFQQSGILWLGTPPEGFDCYTWPDVDAVGLKITEAAAGQVNDMPLSTTRRPASAISDSSRMLCELAPFTLSEMGFTSSGNTVTCTELYLASVMDDVYTTSGGVFLIRAGTERFSYTVPLGVDIPAATVAASIASSVNGSTVYHASAPVQSGNDFSFHITRVDPEDLTPVELEVSYHSPKTGQSNERRLVGVTLSGAVPVVTLEKVIPQAHNFFMFDI